MKFFGCAVRLTVLAGLLLGAASVLAIWSAPAAWAQPAPSCPPAPAVALDLPVLRAAIQRGEPAIIAAFGSSSTRGAAASDAAHGYPAVLQVELMHRLAGAHLAVINRGIGGQDASEQLVRLGSDVIALRPQLVIWQIGTNAAMRGVDPASYRATIIVGVRRLRESGADVILMDSQRAPRIMDAPGRAAIERALTEAAQAVGAAIFSRAGLMDAWRETGQGYDRFLAADALHHNDLGYRCLAEALATTIVTAVRRE